MLLTAASVQYRSSAVKLPEKRAAAVVIQAAGRGHLARCVVSVMRAQAAADAEAARRRSILNFCDVSGGLRGHGGTRRELSIKQRNDHHRQQHQQPLVVVKGVRVTSAGSNRAVDRRARHRRPVSAPIHRRWLSAHERHLRADTARRKLEAWQKVEGAHVDRGKHAETETVTRACGLAGNDEDFTRRRQALAERRKQQRIDAEVQRQRVVREEELARAKRDAEADNLKASAAKAAAEAQAAAAAIDAAVKLAAQEEQAAEQQRHLKASSRGEHLYPLFPSI